MSAESHRVNLDACKGDGICVEICPKDLFEMVDKKASVVGTRVEECIVCGQCIAACLAAAIEMTDFPADHFEKLER